MTNLRDRGGCVITGVAGFVGGHLAERLLSSGYEVVGVDNFFSGYVENMASFKDHPAFTFYERPITQTGLLEQLKKDHPNLKHVFHLAAIVSVPYSVEHPEETMEVNHAAVLALLKSARELGFESFVFAGSAAEYGDDQRLPLLEEYANGNTRHLSPYGRAKFLASQAVASSPGGVALRFFNIYGPRQDPGSPYSGVISRFVDLALEGKTLTIFGDGLQMRDFVYVSDVVEAYVHAAGLGEGSSPNVPMGIYNIGTGRSTTILQLAEIVLELTGNDKALSFGPERPGDIRLSLASVEAFCRASGWIPGVFLKEGLEKTIQWVRKARL